MTAPVPTAEPTPGPTSGPTARRRRDPYAVAAAVLLVLGVLLWVAYRVTIGGERHSYADGAAPPSTVELREGSQYHLAIPGGVATTPALLPDPQSLSCEITGADGGRQDLAVAVEPASTKAINQIGTFTAPVGGRVRIECSGLPAVFVDDAEDAGTDLAGLWLVLASIALAIGLPLLLSALRRRTAPDPPLPAA